MGHDDKLRVEGKVLQLFKGDNFEVELGNGHRVLAYLGGRMRVRKIRVIPGDKVIVELSPYDLTRGRMVWRIG